MTCRVISVCALLIAMTGTCLAQAASSSCTPFGDHPSPTYAFYQDTCFPGGTVIGPLTDSNGTPRYACLYLPRKPAKDPRPLVIYFPPNAYPQVLSMIVDTLVPANNTADLSRDPNARGYILLAPFNRTIRNFYPTTDSNFDITSPTSTDNSWDVWYRQFNPAGAQRVGGVTYPENVDAATTDQFVTLVESQYKVDTNRVYVMGHSNGASMAVEYGLNRPNVAAVAVYSSDSPFGVFEDPCEQTPVAGAPANTAEVQVASPNTPIYEVHPACDIGGICPNIELLASQIEVFGSFTDIIDNIVQAEVPACNAACGTNPNGTASRITLATLSPGNIEHDEWPWAWQDRMFAFLRNHPLSAKP